MTERNEQGFVKDINLAFINIKHESQSSKDRVRALINLPFDFNDVPLINNYINEETTQTVECIDELNNIAILNEQILEFEETLKSKFEERHKELVEALMNRLEGVFKMYNNDDLNQNVQPTYPAVGQPVEVQTPQVEEFNPVTPVESYAAPAVEQPVEVYGGPAETYAEPAVQEPVPVANGVDPMAMTVDVSQIIQPAEMPVADLQPVEPVPEVAPLEAVQEPVPVVSEVAPMAMPADVNQVVQPVEMPVVDLQPVEAPAEETPAEEVEETFAGPELTEDLFRLEAQSLSGIIAPAEENVLPDSADLNTFVGEYEEVSEAKETPEPEEETTVVDEEDEEIRRIREHHREMEEVEVRIWKNKKTLEEKRTEIAELEQGLAADEEELERLRKM